MNLRDSVLTQDHAINSEDLKTLIDQVRQAEKLDSLVSNFEDDEDGWTVNKKIRDTQEVQLTDALVEIINSVVAGGVAISINPFYGVAVRDWERVQILHYGAGGHYIPHVDAETLYKDELGLSLWEKTLDRDLSIVYFLNDDFTGGELVFPELDLVIEPQAGTLVCFPSDHNYIHGVNPVTAGQRYTLVTWMRVNGMPTVEEINEMTMNEYRRLRPKQIEQRPRVVKNGGVVGL